MMVPILQFISAKGAGAAALRRLLGRIEGRVDGRAYAHGLCGSGEALVGELGLSAQVADAIVNTRDEAQRQADRLAQDSIEVLWLGSETYPQRLIHVLGDDAPPYLFVQGNRSLLNGKSVGFCGSRKASAKGLRIAADCARQLALEETCVVSGYAQGVDMAAHLSALEAGGTTLFVLVEGISRFHAKREIQPFLNAENHLVVSQFPPSLSWIGRNAMLRNHTIIGLSDAMILVESGLTGGTFAAGNMTLAHGMGLFVVDYANQVPSAPANPFFIQKGGIPIRSDAKGTPNLSRLRRSIDSGFWRHPKVPQQTLFG